MAASRLVRASNRNADRVKQIADRESRTFIAQLDRIIDAGIEALSLEDQTSTPELERASA